MELTIGFGVEGAHPIEWVIRLNQNFYFLKDTGLEWFEKLKRDLEARDFPHHKWTHVYGKRNKCLYYFMLMTA